MNDYTCYHVQRDFGSGFSLQEIHGTQKTCIDV